MYVLLILGILGVAGWIGWRGLAQRRPSRVWLSVAILLLGLLFFSFLSFWGEMLWYESLGYEGRFWRGVIARVCAIVLGSSLAGGGVFLLTIPIPSSRISARLWDWRALDAVYRHFQEIRLYYEFFDVDMDRYAIGDRYRQVMISARELTQANLPSQSQTFVNRRFKYTHGYGLTLTTVSDFTPEGLRDLLGQLDARSQ